MYLYTIAPSGKSGKVCEGDAGQERRSYAVLDFVEMNEPSWVCRIEW